MAHITEIKPSIQLMSLMGEQSISDTVSSLKRVGAMGFYSCAETAAFASAADSEALRRVTRENGMRWTCWATPFIIGEGLNLSAIDETERLRAVTRLRELLKTAAGSGADAMAVLSGPVPQEPGRIPEAAAAATRSLTELADAASEYREFSLLIEPLDRTVHKKNTIGPTVEAVQAIKDARAVCPRVFMVWDSAHIALMREDLVTSLSVAGDTVGQIHLCNAVLDPASPIYGDFHIFPGRPGYLTRLRAADTIAEAGRLALAVDWLPVAIETNPAAGDDPWAIEARTREFLKEAIRLSSLINE